MAQSYQTLSANLARKAKLLMTDIDGTLTTEDGLLNSGVVESIQRLEQQGIVVGFISGRTIFELVHLARDLGISGPIIAENGGVAMLKENGGLVDLGYSRQPALKALEKLKAQFPNRIKEREDNRERLVDVVIWSLGIKTEDLRSCLEDAQLLDSGYIFHIMQKGISKGRTLITLLGQIGDGGISPSEVLVVGDSATDLSLFELFPNSVLIPNPRFSSEQREILLNATQYVSDRPDGEGFADVALHILNALV